MIICKVNPQIDRNKNIKLTFLCQPSVYSNMTFIQKLVMHISFQSRGHIFDIMKHN